MRFVMEIDLSAMADGREADELSGSCATGPGP